MFGAIKENARIRSEQDADPLLKALKLRILHEQNDKHLLKAEQRAQNLLQHKKRIFMKDGVLTLKKLRGRRYGYPSPGNKTETSGPRTAIHASRQDKRTPWNHHEDDTRMQNKVLVPGISTEN